MRAVPIFVILVSIALLGQSRAAEVASVHVEAENTEAGDDVLAVFVIMLVVGVASYHVLAVTKIPYTALLLVLPPPPQPHLTSPSLAFL